MFRKLIVALGATAIVVSAALAPTAASAKHWHHGWHGSYWYGGYYGPTVLVDTSDCYFVKKVFYTPAGKVVRRVQVCD